jgi:hypothetical protein
MGNEQTTKTNHKQEFVLTKEEQQKNLQDYYNSLHSNIIESKKRTFRATIESECHQTHRRQEAIDYFEYVHEAFKEDNYIQFQNSNLKEKIKKRGKIFAQNLVNMVCQSGIQNKLNLNLSADKAIISLNYFENQNQKIFEKNISDEKIKENIFSQLDSLVKGIQLNEISLSENCFPNSEEIFNESQESCKFKFNTSLTKISNESYSLIHSETCETDFRTERSKRENFNKIKEPLNTTKTFNTFFNDQKFFRSNSPSELKFAHHEESNTQIHKIRSIKVKKLILLNKNHSINSINTVR